MTTDFGVASAEQTAVSPTSASACAVHRDAIELGLSRGRNAMAIWQDLVDTRGFTGGYQSVKRFVRKLVGGPSKEACAVIETAAGEEAQVDYGTGPMVRDPHSGKYRRMRLFVLTLGYSRKSVRLLVFQSSTQTWAELHEKAFRRLGGCTRVVVLDNLARGRAQARHLRSHDQPRIRRHAAALRRGRDALPGARTRIARGRWRAAWAMRRRRR